MNTDRLKLLAGILNEGHFMPDLPITVTQVLPMGGSPSSEMKLYTEKGMYNDSAPDLEIGHTDDEVGMIKDDVKTMCDDVKELYDMLCELNDLNQEVDFPHWWQSKIVMAKDYISKAVHYLHNNMPGSQY